MKVYKALKAQTAPCRFCELPTEGAGYTELNCCDPSISTATENSIIILLKRWHAASRLFPVKQELELCTFVRHTKFDVFYTTHRHKGFHNIC
jgi:hypothetical protein